MRLTMANSSASWHDVLPVSRLVSCSFSVLAAGVIGLGSAACRQEGRAPDRPPPPPGAGPASAPVDPPGSGASAPQATTTTTGSSKLVRAPSDLAKKIALREVAHGLKRPVLLVAAPGDTRRRLFIVEQGGTIRFLEGGALSPKTFFTIGGLATGNEQGLLGLAFHPRFAENGKLYVNYTSKDMTTHVVEYKVSATDPDAVDMKSKRELIAIEQPYSNHNGGNVLFGPDGKLYVGMGDGGAANDPHGNGQNDKALLGKLLRFGADGASPAPEIVHKGLRNPWRFSFDAKTGDLYIGDVGQNLWEYVHDEGCSITGGFVYRGKALPDLDGRYFYADYCTGLLRSFVWTNGAVREHYNWKAAIDRDGVLAQVSSFGVDHDGELYVVELTGAIYKLVPKA
jgi:glucose/arabinose dehydrogenase